MVNSTALIDIVSFGVCPAVVLLSYGDFDAVYLPGAFFIVAAGVLRLSHFNVFGLHEGSTYQGLAIDNNGIVLATLFVFEYLFDASFFAILLYVAIIGLAVLNVAPLRTPKLSGAWYHGVIGVTVALTLIYGWQLLNAPD